MFKADPIREAMRNIWLTGLVLASLGICHVVAPVVEAYVPWTERESAEVSTAWIVLVSIAVCAGAYLAIRDHIYRPFVTLAREVPDPSHMWRLIGRSALSGAIWSPVLCFGLSVLFFDAGGFWTILQIGLLLLAWHLVSARAAPAVTRILEDVLPQSGAQA